jgi:Family of unknown function (DUF5522)
MGTFGPVPELRDDHLQAPLPSRLPPRHPLREEIMRRHARAVGARAPTYRDPATGLSVFTARFLADRGWCCASGCRHCPFEQPGAAG